MLIHVRGHYHDAGLLIEEKIPSAVSSPLPLLNIPKPNEFKNNVYMNNILSMCLSPNAGKLLLQQQQQLHNQQQLHQIQNGTTSIAAMVSIPMVPSAKNVPNTGTASAPSTNEHGETDEASSGGTSVVNGGWRGPAPYRCGHCHQISNWKHVIQVFLLTPHLH